jgi:hypothetical protein
MSTANTRILKWIDLGLQVGTPLLLLSVYGEKGDGLEQLIKTLLCVGCIQLLSFIVHLFALRRPWVSSLRRWYGGLLGALILGVLALAFGADMPLAAAMVLMCLSPLLALLYMAVCAAELSVLHRLQQTP